MNGYPLAEQIATFGALVVSLAVGAVLGAAALLEAVARARFARLALRVCDHCGDPSQHAAPANDNAPTGATWMRRGRAT